MRKFIALVVLTFMLFLQGNAYASNDPWYDVGNAIGSSIANGNPGKDEKNLYRDKSFDFTKIKRICFIASYPDKCSHLIDDKYINKKYPDILIKEFEGSNIKLVDVTTACNKFLALYPNISNSEQRGFLFNEYLRNNYDAVLYINIYAYNRGYYNTGNCALEFKLRPINTYSQQGTEIFYMKDFRLQAPRSWPEGMIKRITSRFKDKLMDTLKESKEKRNC